MASLSTVPFPLSRSPLRRINSTRFRTEMRIISFSICLHACLLSVKSLQNSMPVYKRRISAVSEYTPLDSHHYSSSYSKFRDDCVKSRIFSVAFHCKLSRQIHTENTKDRLRVDDNPVVKNIYIKIALIRRVYKLFYILCRI